MNNLVISFSYLIMILCSYNGPKLELFPFKNRLNHFFLYAIEIHIITSTQKHIINPNHFQHSEEEKWNSWSLFYVC